MLSCSSRLLLSALVISLIPLTSGVSAQGLSRNPSSIMNHAPGEAISENGEVSPSQKALNLLGADDVPIDERITEAAKIVAANPDNGVTWAVLGELRLEAGESDTALLAFERAVAKDPALASSWHWIGTLRKRNRDLEGALAAFRQALTTGAPRTQQMNEIAVTLAQLNRTDEAMKSWDEAIAEDPEWGVLYTNAMKGALQLGNERLARSYFERGLDAERFEEVMVLMWSDYLISRSRERDAIAAHEAGLAKMPDSPRILYSYGMTLKERRRAADATAALIKSRDAAIAQDDIATREAAAKALFSIQHPDAHRRLVSATQKVNTPWSEEAKLTSEMTQARVLLDGIISEHPDLWEAHLLRGTALRRLGEAEAAKADFEKVLASISDQPNALINMAILEQDAGQVDLALEHASKAIIVSGGDWTIPLTAGFIFLEAGDCTRARDMIRETRRRLPRGFPDDPTVVLADEIAALCG